MNRFTERSPIASRRSPVAAVAAARTFTRAILAVSIASLISLGGCTKVPVPAPTVATEQTKEQVFPVRGILHGINFAEQTVNVEHEEIPDYMAEMTMPFDYKSSAEVEPLKVGDAIAFYLVVTDTSSWIQGIRKIPSSELRLTAKQPKAASVTTAKVNRLKEGDVLPSFELIDQKKRTITTETLAGRPVLVTFIFTRCPIPNFCPLMSQNFKKIQEALADAPQLRDQVRYLSISFDTEFDTPEILSMYASNYTQDHDQWRFATGTPEQIEKLTQAFSVYVQPESGTLSHGLCTALIGPDGTIQKIWRGNSWEPSEVVAALRTPGPTVTTASR